MIKLIFVLKIIQIRFSTFVIQIGRLNKKLYSDYKKAKNLNICLKKKFSCRRYLQGDNVRSIVPNAYPIINANELALFFLFEIFL